MAGNKLTLELDSSPNKLIKATLLAWMDLPVAWADWDRYIADNPADDAPAQLTLDDALKVPTPTPARSSAPAVAAVSTCSLSMATITTIASIRTCPYNEEDDPDPIQRGRDEDERSWIPRDLGEC